MFSFLARSFNYFIVLYNQTNPDLVAGVGAQRRQRVDMLSLAGLKPDTMIFPELFLAKLGLEHSETCAKVALCLVNGLDRCFERNTVVFPQRRGLKRCPVPQRVEKDGGNRV